MHARNHGSVRKRARDIALGSDLLVASLWRYFWQSEVSSVFFTYGCQNNVVGTCGWEAVLYMIVGHFENT